MFGLPRGYIRRNTDQYPKGYDTHQHPNIAETRRQFTHPYRAHDGNELDEDDGHDEFGVIKMQHLVAKESGGSHNGLHSHAIKEEGPKKPLEHSQLFYFTIYFPHFPETGFKYI